MMIPQVFYVLLAVKPLETKLFIFTKIFRYYCQKNKINAIYCCKFQVFCYTELVKKNKTIHCFLLRTIIDEYILSYKVCCNDCLYIS